MSKFSKRGQLLQLLVVLVLMHTTGGRQHLHVRSTVSYSTSLIRVFLLDLIVSTVGQHLEVTGAQT